MSLIEDLEASQPTCGVCGGPLPCEPCRKNAERPGTSRRNDTLTAVLPVGEDGVQRIRQMLTDRGFDPDEWDIVSLIVNEWEALRANDQGVRTLTQTKATLRRIPKPEETDWGRLVTALAEIPTAPPRKPRRNLKPASGPQLTVLLGDDQAPSVNWPLHEATCEALADLQPDRLVYMGDGTDFDAVSKHRKDRNEFASTLQQGLDVTHRVLSERLEAAGWPTGDYLIGNHEHRLEKALTDRLPELLGIKKANPIDNEAEVLSMRSLLRLDLLGLEVATSSMGDYPHGQIVVSEGNGHYPVLYASHGWVARKGAGASAQASIERLNAGLIVGHTHRLAVSSVTRWNGDGPDVYPAVETGTMADLRGLGYAKFPDWQPGWVTVTTWPDGTYQIDSAVWRDSTLTWRDRRWTLTKTGVRR